MGIQRAVHFVGVGGIGMSGLAEILLNLGYAVSGSDLHASPITQRLESLGMAFHEDHAAGNLGQAGIVVISAAVPDENVEVLEARRRGIPVIERAELLADLMRLKPTAVAVGGSHGKTTVTSMISAILDHADIGATSIVGGILHRSGTNARWGTGECLVAEACEHNGAFLRLHPTISVVTNVDAEHLDFYGTLDGVKRAFTDFCNRVPFYGCALLCADDANSRAILEDIESTALTFGLHEEASLRAEDMTVVAPDASQPRLAQLDRLRTEFAVHSRDPRFGITGLLGKVSLHALGEHNVCNALAACAVGLCLGMSFDTIAAGLATYDGVQRRLQVAGVVAGVTVVEDYAHHPTEVARVLDAAEMAEAGRTIVVFQPHLYSRTKFFCEDFARELARADRAIVTAIYPAREAPMPGVDAGLIVDAARGAGAQQVELIEDKDAVAGTLAADLEAGDLVLVLGAGDINRIAPAIVAALEARG